MAYITYLRNPEQHSNAAESYPGYGKTKEESRENARYYNNQWPWVVTVAASRAPRWAREQARTGRERELEAAQFVRELTPAEQEELQGYHDARLYCPA